MNPFLAELYGTEQNLGIEKIGMDKTAEQDFLGRLMAHSYVQELNEIEKQAFSVTDEGHEFDAEEAKIRAEYGAKMMELAQRHGGMGSTKRKGSILKALRGFNPDVYQDPRHLEYVAKKHQKGENAWNPLGGALTPSSRERGGTAWRYGEFKKSES